jgi:protein transport protein SEC61 subunit gamma-like protein
MDMEIKNIQQKLKEYYNVLKMTRKPTREEFLKVTKITVAGVLIIGIFGFIIYLLMNDVPGLLK